MNIFTKWKCKMPSICQCKVQNRLHRRIHTHSHLLENRNTAYSDTSRMNQTNARKRENEKRRKETKAKFQMNSIQKKPMYKGKSEGKANTVMYGFFSVYFHLQSLFALTAYVICYCCLYFVCFFRYSFSVGLFTCFFFPFWEKKSCSVELVVSFFLSYILYGSIPLMFVRVCVCAFAICNAYIRMWYIYSTKAI